MRNEPLPTNDNKAMALQVLGLTFGATQEEVKAAFRKKALIFHPDKGGDVKDFIAVKTAYDWLVKHGTEKKDETFLCPVAPVWHRVVYTTGGTTASCTVRIIFT
jgi:hypothetical protein